MEAYTEVGFSKLCVEVCPAQERELDRNSYCSNTLNITDFNFTRSEEVV